MNGTGDQLLSRARLSGDENGRVRALCHHLYELHDALYGFALPDEAGDVVLDILFLDRLNLFPQLDGFEGILDGHLQSPHIQGFDHVIVSAEFHGCDHRIDILVSGDDDYLHVWVGVLDLTKGVDPAHTGKPDIEKDQVGSGLRHGIDRGLGDGKGLHAVVFTEHHRYPVPDRLLVIDDIYGIFNHAGIIPSQREFPPRILRHPRCSRLPGWSHRGR